MNRLNPILIFLLILFSLKSFSMTSAEREYSNELEHRATRFVQLFDASAEVSIATETKSLSAKDGWPSWPGLKTPDQVNELVTKISDSDIKSVNVTIFSTKSEISSEFKKQLIEYLNLPASVIVIKFRSVSKIGKTSADETQLWRQSLAQSFESLTTHAEPGVRLFAYGFILFGILLLCAVVLLIVTLQQKLTLIHTSLDAKDIQATRDTARPVLAEAMPEASASQNRGSDSAGAGGDTHNLRALSVLSWVALLSDCYWCQQDRYAAWLWQNVPHESRREILSVWPKAQTYIDYLTTLKPEERSDHNHPVYLDPAPISQISQGDLQALIKKQASLWRSLSPMRRSTMQLSVSDTLNFDKPQSQSAKSFDLKSLTAPASQARILPQIWYKKSLSAEDEIFLLDKFHEVPASSRTMMPSWVWTVLIPAEDAKKILSPVSAFDLAGAWVGSEEVLKRLQTLIPEQKMKMVEEYRKTIPSVWTSPLLAKTTRMSCQILSTLPVESHKAA